MSRASQPSASPRPGASFEVEQLDVADGHLVISGHWAGVRGIRFVRPTLVAGDRQVLATLEHKPWAAAAGKPWKAAFPWDGTDVDVEGLSLAVAPSVTVRLDAPAGAGGATQSLLFVAEHEPTRALAAVPEDALAAEPEGLVEEVASEQPVAEAEPVAEDAPPTPAPEPAARPSKSAARPSKSAARPSKSAAGPSKPAAGPSKPAAGPSKPASRSSERASRPSKPASQSSEPASEPTEPASRPPELASPARMLRLQDDLAEMTLERNALQRQLEEARQRNAELDERCLELDQAVRVHRRTAQEATDARDDLERARTAAERDRDRVLAQVNEAVQDREAALRTRSRMEIRCEEAVQAREAADAKLAKAVAERDEANAQRDEVLLAYRTLQRQMVSERAEEDRGGPPATVQRAPRSRDSRAAAAGDSPAAGDDGRETPLGVRTMPAARTVMAELQRRQPSPKGPLSSFDLWVMRILGTVAALCFISLLVMILRVFV